MNIARIDYLARRKKVPCRLFEIDCTKKRPSAGVISIESADISVSMPSVMAELAAEECFGF